ISGNKEEEARGSHIIRRRTPGAGWRLTHRRRRGRSTAEGEAQFVRWLARVRGPESKDPPFVALPRPQGRATRAIITEYELPRLELATHDIWGDSKGYLWYSPHRSSFIGRLDPKTGVVKEYRVP